MVEQKCSAWKEALCGHLEQLKPRLDRYRAGAVVAVEALRRENGCLGVDVALTLQKNVSDPLWVEIELINGLLKDCKKAQPKRFERPVKAKKKSRG